MQKHPHESSEMIFPVFFLNVFAVVLGDVEVGRPHSADVDGRSYASEKASETQGCWKNAIWPVRQLRRET